MDKKSILKNVASNWRDLEWWRYVAYPFVVRKAILQPYYRLHLDHEGIRIMDQDWDNLIILDACRYDMFEEAYSGPGTLTSVKSLGSATPEFLTRNFDDQEYYDTVYVTANPQVNVHLDDVFHDVINVWETSWDEELNTVHPESITKVTKEAYDQHPNKRIISHFVQPHYPFIGEYGRSQLNDQAGVELSKQMADGQAAKSNEDHAWLQLRKGVLSESEIRKAYNENLEFSLPYVNELINYFKERTVVTSDHGNMYGESGPFGFPIYGHPNRVYHKDLVTVPWLVVAGSSKELIAESPKKRKASEDVTDRLEQLGYR